MAEHLHREKFKDGLEADGPVTVPLVKFTAVSQVGVDPAFDADALQLRPPDGGWISAMGSVIGAVATPGSPWDAANKQYVDKMAAGSPVWVWSDIAAPPPEPGQIRYNGAGLVYLHYHDANGMYRYDHLLALDAGDHVYLHGLNGAWYDLLLLAPPSDQGTHVVVGVSIVIGTGEITEGHRIAITTSAPQPGAEVSVGPDEPTDPEVKHWIDPTNGGGGTLDQYLPVSGGTVTGSLEVQGDTIAAWVSASLGIDAGGHNITSVADPVEPNDGANKSWVEARNPPMIVLGASDPVPPDTPTGTVIVRTT